MMNLCKCGAPAAWEYLPDDGRYACDKCIKRGCSCQLILKESVEEILKDGLLVNEEDDFEMATDDQGRELPCVEWEPYEEIWCWPLPGNACDVPTDDHPGSFGAQRKYDIHTGVDLYCRLGQPVVVVEDGEVISATWFTGSKADSPWWNDTRAVFVKGKSGVIGYGEIQETVVAGQKVKAGEQIGTVLRVLKKDKGKPTTMLHLELYSDTTKHIWWRLGEEQPEPLLDPTWHLLRSRAFYDDK